MQSLRKWARQRMALAAALAAGMGAAFSFIAAPVEDVVWLRSGERLRGEITGFTGDGWFGWRHAFIAEELKLALTNVLKIRFASRAGALSAMETPCRLRLINGDTLTGVLSGYDGTHLTIESPACGRLHIHRQTLDALHPMELNPQVVYQGPTGLEGWVIGQGVEGVFNDAWVYGNGAFIAVRPGSIARDLKLPDLMELSFVAEWEGQTRIAVALYADRLQPIPLSAKENAPDFGGFYSLQITLAGYIAATLVPIKKEEPYNPQGLGLAFVQARTQEPRAHFVVRANKKERTVLLYYNGELLRRWQDPTNTLGAGTVLRIVNNGEGTVRISQLEVKHWDGRQGLQSNAAPPSTNDVVVLLNQDRVSGILGNLRQKEWEILTPLGPVQVPLSRIDQLHFSALKRQTIPAVRPPVQLTLVTQDRLGIQLEQWADGRLTGLHPLLGRLEIKSNALREMVME